MMASAVTIATLVAFDNSRGLCGSFVAMGRLPTGFEQIAGAELANGEFFVMSNGQCTCDNGPALHRLNGRPTSAGINWSCHPTTKDERGVPN